MDNAVRASALDVSTPAIGRGRALLRIGWTVLTILLIQGFVCGFRALAGGAHLVAGSCSH